MSNMSRKTNDAGREEESATVCHVRPVELLFPYGGGTTICPGRFFAKQEILLTIGLLVSKFDIEFVEWTMHDGSPSDRAPKNDPGGVRISLVCRLTAT